MGVSLLAAAVGRRSCHHEPEGKKRQYSRPVNEGHIRAGENEGGNECAHFTILHHVHINLWNEQVMCARISVIKNKKIGNAGVCGQNCLCVYLS